MPSPGCRATGVAASEKDLWQGIVVMTRGRYLVLEGVEGAGKTVVARTIADAWRNEGRKVVEVREPGGTHLGEKIRQLVLHSEGMAAWAEALLFAAQRAQLAAEIIGPALTAGTDVVADRSYYSSLAYQGGARGLGIEAVRYVNESGLDGVLPDLVAVLWVEPQVGLNRQHQPDRIGSLGLEFQEKVADAYRQLAQSDPKVVIVEGSGDAAVVAGMVLAEAARRWP